MSSTRHERQKMLSDRIRAVWDARRDDVENWQADFEDARENKATETEADAQLIRSMPWDEFQRLQKIDLGFEGARRE